MRSGEGTTSRSSTDWMEGMSATLTSINNEGDADKAITVQQEAVGGGVEYFNWQLTCRVKYPKA